jgi:ADP-ribose pyrophosphatase YjhB (NUDIX family)
MEKEILSQFLYEDKLKFNEIEKKVNSRSNKLSYHIKKLVKKGVIEKDKDDYKLSKNSEPLIPYLTNKTHVLPVVLVLINNKNKTFLIKREKRPYKNKFGLPGGRILIGETIQETTQRIMKEKFNVKCNFKKVNSISLEFVRDKENIVHSFLLILVTATTKNKINYCDLNELKKNIISSDYKLITEDFNKEMKVRKIESRVN